MHRLFLFVAAIALLTSSACTALQPVEASAEDLQRMIISEGLIRPGERVRVVTSDEVAHDIRVTDVDRDQGLIVGKRESIEIVDIVAVETREVSVGRTALLTGGVGTGIAVLIAIAVAPAVILGGG